MSDPGKIIRPGRWTFLTWGRLMKGNSQKQRCLALRYDLLECFALLVMECCYSLWPNKRKSSGFPYGRPGRTFLFSCWSSPWPRKEFDWNGDVATRVDMRTTKVKFFKKYLSKGMSDPSKIIRPGRWMFITWGRLMKGNSQKQRCHALRYDLLECFALLVMECCYSLWPNKRKSSWLPVR